MTLSTETNKIVYAGLIGQDTFAYNFRVDEESDMEVYLDAALIDPGPALRRARPQCSRAPALQEA